MRNGASYTLTRSPRSVVTVLHKGILQLKCGDILLLMGSVLQVGQRHVREWVRRRRGFAAGTAQEGPRGPHQAAHERLHGVVPAPASQDRPGQPQDAQL